MNARFLRLTIVLASLMVLASCGGGGGTSNTRSGTSNPGVGDWFYHWNCNGDPVCLTSNPEVEGSGNYDVGPNKSSCTALLTYAQQAWGPNTTDFCDQLPTGASNPRGKMQFAQLTVTTAPPGAVIYVAGDNIDVSTVTINGVWADVVAENNTQIAFQVPNMANFTGPVVFTGPGGTVKLSPSLTVINAFNAVSADGPRYVVAGDGDTLISSDDAVHWTQVNLGTDTGLGGIAYSGSSYVAAGGEVFSSTDGRTWVAETQSNVNAIASSGSLFVAVGDSGDFGTSANGTSWTFGRVCSCSADFFAVAWSPTLSKFLAVGKHGTTYGSPDGVNWTAQTPGAGKDLHGLIWTGTDFVAAGETGTVLISSDGVNWNRYSTRTSDLLYGVAWSGTLYVAVGDNGVIFTSPDGTTWTPRSSGNGNPLYAVAWSPAGGQFIAVGDSSTILTSPDGINWTQRAAP